MTESMADHRAEPMDRRSAREPSSKPLTPDYFDLQLKFAQVVSELTSAVLAHTVFTHTNFFMRLSFGAGHELDEQLPAWREFVDGLLVAPDRAAFAYNTYLNAPPERPSLATRFGCFSVDAVGDDGVVRLHFSNRETAGTSPLSAVRVANRHHELRTLFAHVQRAYPHARTVRGNSWLYHFESYRRLFPAVFGASRSVLRHSAVIQGSSRWGQFLDRNGRVAGDVKANFLANLSKVDADHLCDAFPIPTYRTEAPVTEFNRFLASTA
jgi:hypothetical protein